MDRVDGNQAKVDVPNSRLRKVYVTPTLVTLDVGRRTGSGTATSSLENAGGAVYRTAS